MVSVDARARACHGVAIQVRWRFQELRRQWKEVVQGLCLQYTEPYVTHTKDIFQIDQDGMSAPPLSSRNWGTAKVLKNLFWESTVPKSLAPGNYLVRHELLALHQANTPQFYAECAQVCYARQRRF